MNKQPVIEKLYFMLGRLVNERLCAVQGSYCASVSVWGLMMAFHESKRVDFISVMLQGILAHIGVIVYWRMEASFPSPAAVHIWLLFIFLSVTPPVFQNFSNSLLKFTSGSWKYVCWAHCSLCQKPKGQVHFDSWRERKKKKLFLAALQL